MSASKGAAETLGLPPISERVFFITGATDGIGKFTAELLAKEGSTVLIHGRNPSKLKKTIEELTMLTKNEKNPWILS